MFFKKRTKTEKTNIHELRRLLEIVETGFYCDSKLVDRLAAVSALGSMKTILRVMNEPHSYKGTQAEELEKLMMRKKAN